MASRPFSLPPGYYDLYGLPRPRPAEGAVQAKRSGLHQSPPAAPGALEYYGIVPRATSSGSSGPVQQKEEAQVDSTSATAPKTFAVDATIASAEPMAVQAKSQGAAAESEAERVHEAAVQGTQGPSGSLPYIDQIQKSFGKHDVSHIKAHTDGQAAAGARAMGAEAFTTGDHVAFAGAPSLHTAAHEAAHVVQQRAGVQLKGGVGEVGDRYEQHADAVADLVVRGQSAEALLEAHGAPGRHGPSPGGPVQAKEAAPGRYESRPETDGYGGVYKAVQEDDVLLVTDATKPKDTTIAKLKKGEVVQLVDIGASEAFNTGVEAGKKWWKVKAISGGSKGKEGWAKASHLGTVLNIKDQGKKEHSGKAGDGEVTVRTGLEVEALGNPFGDNMFAIQYEGKDADQARWLQFIWREVIGLDDKGAASPITGSITTSGGTYQLTEGGTKDAAGTPKKENYNTDSKDKSDPFYEAGFSADRTADSTTMYDQPGSAVDKAADAFASGAKTVVSRAHFATFLVKQRKISYQTHINVQWSFAKSEDTKKPPKGKHTVSQSGEVLQLPEIIRQRFHEQFPAYKDVQ